MKSKAQVSPAAAPAFFGGAGRAWRIIDNREVAKTTVAAWLVEAPRAHPLWSWYLLGIVTLKPVPGMPPAKLTYPEAEYEMFIIALDPEHPLPALIDPKPGSLQYLEPVDVAEQFHGISPLQAEQLGRSCVRAICDGVISPDQDFRSTWKEVVKQTVEHISIGGHPKAMA